ncbi:MAG: EamA family transporter [Tannerellaceae bacterium]|jgi:undecaprenyl phosphate-alpha-L-ara4N flippase subunit ArnE|nr:EamA family transporter [Tannerellaceae bacterium]
MRIILAFAVLQSMLLAAGQVFLKIGLGRINGVSLSWKFIASQIVNWPLAAAGGCLTAATLLWIYMLRRFEFGVVYPMTSLGYLFGMIAAATIFQEHIPPTRWLGLALVIAGIILIAK